MSKFVEAIQKWYVTSGEMKGEFETQGVEEAMQRLVSSCGDITKLSAFICAHLAGETIFSSKEEKK